MITASTQGEIESFLKLMMHKFSENICKYENLKLVSAKEKANQEVQLLLDNQNTDWFWTKKLNDEYIGSLWLQERDNDFMLVYVYIEEAFRHQGHGMELMEHIDLHLSASKKDKIVLHVFSENKSAVELYSKCGFTDRSIIMTKQIIKE